MLNKEQTLGEGSVGRLILTLAIPTVVSQVVNMLYNIVDRIYIGHIPETGVVALTGLGLCYPIIMIVSAFSSLFGMGGAPKAAIAMGKGDHEHAEKILGNCTTALMISAVVLMSVLVLFGEPLLYLFGASDATITYALAYLRIYAFGTMFVQITLGLNTFITTQGFAKFSMLTVVIGAVTNIILDPIFIYGFNMGVRGAALATTISQAISAIWVLRFLTGNRTKLKIKKANMRLVATIILPVMALGLSPFIMTSTESILNICFNVSLQKYGGDLAVGAMTILGSVMSLCFMPITGIVQGIQPVISFNFGARKMDRVKTAITYQIAVCASFTTLAWLVLRIVPELFISLFNSDPTLLEYTVWSMNIYTAGLFILGVQVACQQTFVALGRAKISMFLACLRKIILLIPLIFILPNFFENKVFAVFLAEPVADIIAATTTIIVFTIVMRSVFKKEEDLGYSE